VSISDFGPRLRTVEGIARHVQERIREIVPDGPYCILGWSSAAAVAYESVIQLLGQDVQVNFLGLVDPVWPNSFASYFPQLLPLTVHFVLTGAVQPPSGSTEVEQAWGTATPQRVELAVENMDLSAIVDALEDSFIPRAAKEAYSPLVTIQDGRGEGDTLYCIPGAGDSVFQFLPFTSGLVTSGLEGNRVFGLQPRGLDERLLPHTTVEAAARSYAAAITLYAPPKRLHLIGHSFGGWVAFETALLLVDAGLAVESLTLIDSSAPQDTTLNLERSWYDVLVHWVDLLQLAVDDGRLLIDRRLLVEFHPHAALSYIHRQMVECDLLSPRSRWESLRGALRTFAAAVRTGYCPSTLFEGKALYVFAADDKSDRRADHERRESALTFWQRFAPNLGCQDGPGNHITILKDPHAKHLAHWWRSAHE